jgi:hypothetical protein
LAAIFGFGDSQTSPTSISQEGRGISKTLTAVWDRTVKTADFARAEAFGLD